MSDDASRNAVENAGRVGLRNLRVDARENRDRVVAAAREAFAAHGVDVPMSEIARRAGVGVATLYRRFPTKESLVAEAFSDRVAACITLIEDALADPDPWRGFCSVVESVCEMQTVDRGFTAALISAFPDAVAFEQTRAHLERGFAELTRRAKGSGQLRADFVPEDLTLLIMANGGVVADAAAVAPAASRRFLAYLLQSFRATPTVPAEPLPPAVPLGLHLLFRPEAE